MLKKILIGSGTALLLLIMVLCVHIYLVTRPKAPDANTRIMARINFRQDITQADANKIATWLYAQNGVSHVLCNPDGDLAIFTYAPVKSNADAIVSSMNKTLPYSVVRFMPGKEEMKKGCPVAAGSFFFQSLQSF